MKDETREQRRTLLWAIPASLILHALIAAFLVYGLPTLPEHPQEEQAVKVALVPPPDQPKPAPKPPEAKKPPEPKPPEQKVEKPPEPRKPPSQEKPSPFEILKPVFKFGDKDAGPRKSLDGASAQDNSPSPAKDKDSKPPVEPKEAEAKPAAPPDSEKQADTARVDEKPATAAKDEPAQEKPATSPQDTASKEADKQEAGAHDADKQTPAPETPLAAVGGDGEIALPASAEAPKPRPENAPKSGPAKVAKSGSGSTGRPSSTDVASAKSGLPGVRKLYSQGATGDPLATTSMADVPRDQRGAKLCASALQQQLLDASYFPDLVPMVPLKAGNVLDVPNAAFHAQTWYGLSFRCELDSDVTTVLSFTFRVGAPIPPDQWLRLGLPMRF